MITNGCSCAAVGEARGQEIDLTQSLQLAREAETTTPRFPWSPSWPGDLDPSLFGGSGCDSLLGAHGDCAGEGSGDGDFLAVQARMLLQGFLTEAQLTRQVCSQITNEG